MFELDRIWNENGCSCFKLDGIVWKWMLWFENGCSSLKLVGIVRNLIGIV